MEEDRGILEGQPPPTMVEVAPKKEIGDEELGNLISAFGNHELKALTLAAMRPGIIYTRRGSEGTTLTQELRRHLRGKRTAWKIEPKNLFGYCQHSLSHPLTLVAKEAVDRYLGIYGYTITPYGIEKGQTLAGHLLDWSLKHDKSLIEVFGSTASRAKSKEIEVGEEKVEFKKRAPIRRLQILQQLLTAPSLPIRAVDLTKALGENPHIDVHLISLALLGIIDYQNTQVDQSYSFYQLVEQRFYKEPEPYSLGRHKELTLTRQIYNSFFSDPNLKASSREVYQRLIEFDPAYQERKQSNILKRINRILSHLQKKGYLKHVGFRNDIQSEISLTEDQRKMLANLLQIIDRFQSGDREFWQEGRTKAQDILTDPEKLAKLINKARETSPGAKRIPREDLENQLFALLLRYPNSTARQLQEYLDRVYGKRLGQNHVAKILRNTGRFVTQEKHSAIYWTVKTD